MAGDASLVLGIDVGTSGVRCVALDAAEQVQARGACALPAPRVEGPRVTQAPGCWWEAVDGAVVQALSGLARDQVAAIAVDATSGTLLLADADGTPLGDASMYNDASAAAEAQLIAAVAAPDSPARGGTSPLARLLQAQQRWPLARHALHQADWIAGRLCGRFGVSDENNVLKLGYDLPARAWPAWFDAIGVRRTLLPQVVPPGTPLGPLGADLARRWGLRAGVRIVAGTTDGVAAFLATGAGEPGDAVSSLGSTLVVKVLAERPIASPAHGVYSHRLGKLWLPGGASNAGGAALRSFFDLPRIVVLSARLDPERPTGLDYYPLPSPGERFPIADATLAPRVAPRPSDDARFLQGLLEGLAAIERQAYERLAELGAPWPHRLFSVGGGTHNPAWMRLRERALGVPFATARHADAACGAARLARQALRSGAAYAPRD
ncbi:MAG: FGGY-family carbohydrate kinase [Piscinibacter sp.]|nr:FGGY-family carbohydrate kinase [Piscinibacter sp.]